MVLYMLLHATLHDTRASLDAANMEDHAQLRKSQNQIYCFQDSRDLTTWLNTFLRPLKLDMVTQMVKGIWLYPKSRVPQTLQWR